MDEECSASVDISAQHAKTLVGRVPGLYDDVVQFISQEVFDHTLVPGLDFEEIGKHANRRKATLHHARLEEAADGFSRISMLGDNRFERALLAQCGRVLGAKDIEVCLGLTFGELL